MIGIPYIYLFFVLYINKIVSSFFEMLSVFCFFIPRKRRKIKYTQKTQRH